ncbi:MAG: NAD(P)H-dependent oxidoreductase [Clostridiales bacterium]|nr:NAD(P)H-dependent oxidoreductase [Clostridiales bacterium]
MGNPEKNQAILDVFQFRHACKKFDPNKPVSDEDFDTILQAARLSPTSFGFEPWKMIVLTDEAIRQKLYPFAWGARNSLDTASRFVILLARKKADTLYSAEFIAHMMRDIHHLPPEAVHQRRERYRLFQEDDFELLESDRALFDWAGKQTYIVLANMLTVAAFLGIDSCPIEGFHRRKADALLAEAGLIDPDRFGVSVMASFGYRAEPPRHEKTRQPLDELIIWK